MSEVRSPHGLFFFGFEFSFFPFSFLFFTSPARARAEFQLGQRYGLMNVSQ
jgi:hypothetical protein